MDGRKNSLVGWLLIFWAIFYILRDDDEEMSQKPCDDALDDENSPQWPNDGKSCDIIIDHIPPKTNVIMEKQLFEDVSHIRQGDFPASGKCLKIHGRHYKPNNFLAKLK